MALPRHKSIFDEEHPVVDTGITYAQPDADYSVIGIALKNPNVRGKNVVIMRGAILCPDPDDEDALPNETDSENTSLINHVVDIFNDLKRWITDNKTALGLVQAGGTFYAQESAKSWDEFAPPTRMKNLTMESGHKYRLSGMIDKRDIRNTKYLKPGDALAYYHILIRVNGQECVPVIVGQNWH